MIKTIQYHLAEDKDFQEQLEAEQSERLRSIWQTNKAVFSTFMPNLMAVFSEQVVDEYGLFCNKLGHFNLAGKSNGQVIYDLNPKEECAEEVELFRHQAPVIHLSGNHVRPTPLLRAYQMPESKGYVPALPVKPLPEQPETVVLFGLGMGHVLEALLKVCRPQNIIVYEPTLDFFRASVQVANWQSIFLTAQDHGVRLFLQIGQNAAGIGSDLKELREAFNADEIFLLRHYHHPVMDAVYDYLLSPEFSLEHLLSGDVEVQPLLAVTDYVAPRAGRVQSSIDREQATEIIARATQLKEKNLAAFAEQFPQIFEEFRNYQPRQWQAFVGSDGELNLYHEQRLGALYHDKPSEQALQSLDLFSEEPNRNDMFAGYKGGKLRRYIHFTHARRLGKVFDELEDEGKFVPDILSSVIWFGLGLGYQLESLVDRFDVKSLYVYEPNPDYFYWSLFTIPWHEILPRQREAGMHWYMNIGDDGTYLAEDMFSQFHSEGGYLTATAYFYVPMYYPAMQGNIKQLKRDFQSYLMLCEYYDHVRYFLRHSMANLERGARVLRKDAGLPESLENIPVLLVGNGPSLDQTIELLKTRASEYVVVSCGTALKPLYEAGITPDFHADVEQNRATYQWVTQVPDKEWLSKITVITLTSLHPDTAALFKEQWAVFKYGESGTACFLRSPAAKKQFYTLDYCYPTVTNLALSLVTAIGFKNIYMTGVDLGYKDHEHHHSKNSAYYQSKSEKSWHDYRKSAGDAIPVRGNFDPYVYTKYEFQLASRIMSQLLREMPEVVVTNTSDGSYVEGTQALRFEDIPTQTGFDKAALLQHLREELFVRDGVPELLQRLEGLNNHERINAEVDALLALIDTPVHTRQEAMDRLSQEKDMLGQLFLEEKSLWFYLIYASSHFFSSALVRLLYMSNDEAKALANFEQGTQLWRNYIEQARDEWIENGDAFDQTIVKALLPKEPTPPAPDATAAGTA